MEEHDEQVENFAEDEPAEIYVVPEKTKNYFFEILGNKRTNEQVPNFTENCKILKRSPNDWFSSNLLVGNILSEKCN